MKSLQPARQLIRGVSPQTKETIMKVAFLAGTILLASMTGCSSENPPSGNVKIIAEPSQAKGDAEKGGGTPAPLGKPPSFLIPFGLESPNLISLSILSGDVEKEISDAGLKDLFQKAKKAVDEADRLLMEAAEHLRRADFQAATSLTKRAGRSQQEAETTTNLVSAGLLFHRLRAHARDKSKYQELYASIRDLRQKCLARNQAGAQEHVALLATMVASQAISLMRAVELDTAIQEPVLNQWLAWKEDSSKGNEGTRAKEAVVANLAKATEELRRGIRESDDWLKYLGGKLSDTELREMADRIRGHSMRLFWPLDEAQRSFNKMYEYASEKAKKAGANEPSKE